MPRPEEKEEYTQNVITVYEKYREKKSPDSVQDQSTSFSPVSTRSELSIQNLLEKSMYIKESIKVVIFNM